MEKRKRGTRSRGWVFRSKSIEGQESHREWQEQSCFHRLARRNSTIPDLARTMLVRRQYRAPFLIGSCVGALSFSSWYRMNERERERARRTDKSSGEIFQARTICLRTNRPFAIANDYAFQLHIAKKFIPLSPALPFQYYRSFLRFKICTMMFAFFND